MKRHVSTALGLMLMVAPLIQAHASIRGFLGNMPSASELKDGTAMGSSGFREPVYRTYQTRSTNKCLDATGAENGSPVVQWDCWADNYRGFNQKWLVGTSKDGYSMVHPESTDKCLDATGGENGSPVVQWDCWGGENQRWKLMQVGDVGNLSYRFVNQKYGKCLDATGGENGSRVVLWDCWEGENQKWYNPSDQKQDDPKAKAAVDSIGVISQGVGIFGGGTKVGL
ncbi:RICIN domain-containing protein [Pyxidicoccus parkwayensis]|uniref:RICIN domain-containing protein n=1 Tax=Pyxidicoccus parkwayensis TaxID=2813578 RepID=A0ABX7P1X5_9BACT|nr:RICIN domain-containing protein [Pyxidicoccus parkwaysis]QSQ22808.1 RICIN domain-containing protein [Pyxidicoccus parkwaysis]